MPEQRREHTVAASLADGIDGAEEMVHVLDDERLHELIGVRPATLDQLRERYRRLVTRPPAPDQRWLNWIFRRADDQVPIGTLQATMFLADGRMASAEVAWVISPSWQGQGYATEAARAVVVWLRGHGVPRLCAHIHLDNHASAVSRHGSGFGRRATSMKGRRCGAPTTSTFHAGSSASEDQGR